MIKPRRLPISVDLDIMAKTLYGEARNQGALGMEAVGCVIINRWRSNKWFNGTDTNNDSYESIAEVCQQPLQFSCWNKNNPGLLEMLACNLYNAPFRDCLTIALLVITNSADSRWEGRDKSNGATHYFADTIATPKWAVGKSPCQIIRNHKFFKNID